MSNDKKLRRLTAHLLTPRETKEVAGGQSYCQHKQTGDPYRQQNGYNKTPQFDQTCPTPKTQFDFM